MAPSKSRRAHTNSFHTNSLGVFNPIQGICPDFPDKTTVSLASTTMHGVAVYVAQMPIIFIDAIVAIVSAKHQVTFDHDKIELSQRRNARSKQTKLVNQNLAQDLTQTTTLRKFYQ